MPPSAARRQQGPWRAGYLVLLSSLLGGLLVTLSEATPFHGVEFPAGVSSFADAVVSYAPVIKGGDPALRARDATEALGPPNYPETPTVGFVSLGDGGSLTLQFTDNVLTGSGDNQLDLFIFEIGPVAEDTFVDISTNGLQFVSVGKVAGGKNGVDIDAFGFSPGSRFAFVRLTDDPSQGSHSGDTVGADIDAVGAISSAPPITPVPEPSPTVLFSMGIMTSLIGVQLVRQQRAASARRLHACHGHSDPMS